MDKIDVGFFYIFSLVFLGGAGKINFCCQRQWWIGSNQGAIALRNVFQLQLILRFAISIVYIFFPSFIRLVARPAIFFRLISFLSSPHPFPSYTSSLSIIISRYNNKDNNSSFLHQFHRHQSWFVSRLPPPFFIYIPPNNNNNKS